MVESFSKKEKEYFNTAQSNINSGADYYREVAVYNRDVAKLNEDLQKEYSKSIGIKQDVLGRLQAGRNAS